MVLRVSNGAPFLVLAPPPTVRTGIRVEIYDRDNPNTLLDILPDTRARRWLDELRGEGSGSFEIHALDPKLTANPTLLTYGNIVRFYLNGILRSGFRIEAVDKVQATEEDDAGRWLTVSGRGPIGILEEAVTYPAGGLGGGTDPRSWSATYPGQIIRTLIAEAQTRGALVGVTTDFTDTTDSNSAPFAIDLTLEEDVGNDYLRIAKRHAELAVDVWMTPQLILKYANTRGIDRTLQLVNTGPVKLDLGFDITELANRETGRITNTALILTPAGLLERTDGGSQTTYNRREGFLSLGNTASSDTVDKAATALFAELANPQSAATLELLERAGAEPYVDFEVGDWILAPNPQGVLTKQRVRALTVTETESGRVRYVPELATVEEELEERLNRWLAAMAKGTMGGSASDIAEPNTVTTQGTTTIVDSGITNHLATQPHFDELSDLADVDVAGVQDLDLLQYDGPNNEWVPVDPSILGGSAFIGEDVAATAEAFLEVGSIPSGYRAIKLVAILRSDSAGVTSDGLELNVGNGSIDTGANYDFTRIYDGTSEGNDDNTGQNAIRGEGAVPAATADAGRFAVVEIVIPDYDATTRQRFIGIRSLSRRTSSQYFVIENWGRWTNSSAAIDVVRLTPQNGNNWVAGSLLQVFAGV